MAHAGSITIIKVLNAATKGSVMPVPHSTPLVKQALTSGATSVVSTVVAPTPNLNPPRQFWRIVFPVDVWIKFGANPIAAVGNDFFLPANTVGEFSAISGDKVAVINA